MRLSVLLTVLGQFVASARRLLREAIPPRIRIHWVGLRNWVSGEPELRLVPDLCDPHKVSIDIGASMGTYGYFMRQRSGFVILVEPRPLAARWLRRAFGPGAEIVEVAASDREGKILLRVPREPVQRGMATVDPENRLEGVALDGLQVEARRLDGMEIGPTGLIKIDVEGHEAAVLRGAQGIIERDHPVFIIEAEERHRPGAVEEVQRTLSSQGYDGWYLLDGRLYPLSTFDVQRDQPQAGVHGGRKVRGKRYINNFIFVHRDDERRHGLLRRKGGEVLAPP